MKSYQVRSTQNLADPLTKYIDGAEQFVLSNEWKRGPAWLCEDKNLWTLRSYCLGDGRLVEEGQDGVSHHDPDPAEDEEDADEDAGQEDDDDGDEDAGQEDDDDEDEEEHDEDPIEVSYWISEDVQHNDENETPICIKNKEGRTSDSDHTTQIDQQQGQQKQQGQQRQQENKTDDINVLGEVDENEGVNSERAEPGENRGDNILSGGAGVNINDCVIPNRTMKTETNEEQGKEPVFSQLLNNVSRIRLAARSIARIRNAFKRKSFKGIQENPTEDQEREAFLLICKDQQRGREEEIRKSGSKAFEQDDGFFSSQRWSSEMHAMLFSGADKLPLVALKSRLGLLLLHLAHRPPNSPCQTDDHAKSAIRSGPFQALLYGGSEKNELSKIRGQCVTCRKMKLEIRGGEMSSYKPVMKRDEYKSLGCPFFSKISIDTTGPVMVGEEGANTRGRKKYQKRHILIISDLVGSGAVRFKQISSTAAAAVIIGLKQHAAEVGQHPDLIYHDSASSFRSIAANEGVQIDKKTEEELKKKGEKELSRAFPSTTFRDCGSSSQYRNALAERGCYFLKRYIRSSLGLKPKCPLPQFTCFGLNLLLSVAENVANSRPLTYLKKTGTYITANHLLRTTGASYLWNEEDSIEEKYSAIQEYRTRMTEALTEEMRKLSFLPQKWATEGSRASIGDFIMVARQKSKVNPLGRVEFGLVEEILDEGRNLRIKVARANTKEVLVREIVADSRNCYLIHREEE